jgi:hypothetical protein
MIYSAKFGIPVLLATALVLPAAPVPDAGPDLSEPAEPAEASLRYGASLVAAFPRQALQTAKLRTGLGIGLFAESDPAPGTTLQTWIQFVRFPQADNPPQGVLNDYLDPDSLTVAANTFSLGVDARLHLPRPGLERVFVMAGLLVSRFEFQSSRVEMVTDASGQVVAQTVRRTDSTPFKLGLSVGAGVDLHKNVTLTLRYSHVPLPGLTLATLETGLSYRF